MFDKTYTDRAGNKVFELRVGFDEIVLVAHMLDAAEYDLPETVEFAMSAEEFEILIDALNEAKASLPVLS